jgi:hypothetical protein
MFGWFSATLLMFALTVVSPANGADLARFVGHWSCKGNFVTADCKLTHLCRLRFDLPLV